LEMGEAAGVQIAALAERDQLVDDPLHFLGLGQGRLDLLMLDQRAGHVGEHRLAMLMGAVQLAIAVSVAHFFVSFSESLCFVRGALRRDDSSLGPPPSRRRARVDSRRAARRPSRMAQNWSSYLRARSSMFSGGQSGDVHAEVQAHLR
jgi:hypothetical protein